MMTADPEAAARLLQITADELPDPDDPMGLLGSHGHRAGGEP